jgi:outer membrane protein assembly factor BamD
LSVPALPAGAQPDKVLYQKAVNEIDRGRYDVGRLTLQALINTYPDSEYLAKAKLAIADSYYNEGGVSGLTQAEAEYKDFITFFPTAPEAPEAQFRVAMAHFHLMAKADRDRTEAQLAEAEFKEFLTKYPDSTLMPRAKSRLREVQEVLGEGDFKIATFYYLRGSNPAAKSRFQEIIDRYPSFSQADGALWYLGQTCERLKTPKAAAPYYARLITDYPLSPHVDEAKDRLASLHEPIPKPTRAMMARARADAVRGPKRDPFSQLTGMMAGAPNTSATRHGPVRLGSRSTAEVETAKTSEGEVGGNTIVAKPVSDESLAAGKAVDPKSPEDPPAGASESSTDPQTSATVATGDSAETVPQKKKGRFHIFKKLVKPF